MSTNDKVRACDFDYHAPEVIIPDLRAMRDIVADNAADLIEDLLARLTAAEADAEKWVSIAVDLATNLTWAMNIDTADYERQAACLAAYDEALRTRQS